MVFWGNKGADPDGWIYRSHKQIEEETYLTRREQGLIRKKLVKLGLIEETLKQVAGKAPTIHFKLSPEGFDNMFGSHCLGCTKCTGGVPNVQGACTKCRNPLYTVDNYTVDNKKESQQSSNDDCDKTLKFTEKDLEMANLLADLIKENNPDWQLKGGIETWASHINKLHRLDGRTYRQIEYTIRWTQKDQFWQQNILSTAKLRKQFNDLIPKMKASYYESHTEIIGLEYKK